MKKLLTNAKIIDFKNNKFKDVDILINDNVIEQIFEKSENFAQNYAKFIDFNEIETINCKNNIILYGFINSSSSLIKNFFESFVSNLTLEEFNEKFETFFNNLKIEEKYVIYKFQILNLIKNGIVTFCDEDNFNLALKKAVKETKINSVFRLGYKNCFDDFDANIVEKCVKENQDFVFSLGGVLLNSEENFEEIIKLSKKYNKPVFVGGSQNLFEAGTVEIEFNKTCTEILQNYGVMDVDHVILNNNVLDKQDYEILSENNSKLIYSPSLNLTLGNKNANIYALEKTNLIGLSSFKNNYDLEMFLTNNLENESYNKIETFSATKIYEFATKNNAQILGLKSQGEIKSGQLANLLIVQNDNIFSDANSFLKNFETSKINSVFINGELVYNSNHFVFINDYEHLKQLCFSLTKKYQITK